MAQSHKVQSPGRFAFATFARLAAFSLVLFLAGLGRAAASSTGYTGIFGGGPFYNNAANNITEIENSGFTEAIVWSVEVKSNGDLNFNGEFPLTSNGAYIGNQTHPDFASNMAQLKQGTVKRVTFSVGSSNVGDWQDITALVNAQGTGPDSILYKDFAALKAAIPALDAIDFDDENSFNSPTTIAFGVMLGNLGYHVVPDPFDNASYWENVVAQINSQLPGTADGVHLQCYAGGAGNNPCDGWNFGSVPVWPGLWDRNDTPARVESIMSGWNSECGINGGFMWLYDDFVGNGLAAQYASAINTAVSGEGFTISGPSEVFLNESSRAEEVVTITDENGFNGKVDLSVSGLPSGVGWALSTQGHKGKLMLDASPIAVPGFYPVTITGVSGEIKETFTFTLAVSGAIGSSGHGTQVDLSSAFNRTGIYTDGTKYSGGGLDGMGYSYSANLLGASRVVHNALFNFGPANAPDVVVCNRQTIPLPQGKYRRLLLLATAINGDQKLQPFVVNYTDDTLTVRRLSLSDWFTPGSYLHQEEAVAMPYRNTDKGKKDRRTFNLYAYKFDVDPSKTVESMTLLANGNVVILAATLVQ